jgi:hypothetical protein
VFRWGILLPLLIAAPAAAQERNGWQPPTLTNTRYDENWSMPSPAEQSGNWLALKYIPLGDDAFLTTGMDVRLRYEAYRDNGWGDAAAPDDSYLWARAMPYADLHVGRVRGFAQPILAYAIGMSPSPTPVDQTRLDMLQAFADVRFGDAEKGSSEGSGFTLRVGRQMVSLGTERLVGIRYGPNVPRAFDGLRGLLAIGKTTINLLALKPVQPGGNTLDDRRSRTKSLWGAYATLAGLDVYYLGYRNRTANFGSRQGRELRHSIGARSFGSAGNWHWNVEGVGQFGRFAGGPIAAWTLGTELGRRFPSSLLAPDALVRFDIISGDRKSTDNRLGTFNALFPKGKYFGELSPVGPYNIINVNPQVAVSLRSDLSASVAGMAYWRYSRGDGVYDVPGNLIRAPGNTRARFIGKQVEGTLAWQATRELELSTSLSAFVPGPVIRETGTAKTIVLFGLEGSFRM